MVDEEARRIFSMMSWRLGVATCARDLSDVYAPRSEERLDCGKYQQAGPSADQIDLVAMSRVLDSVHPPRPSRDRKLDRFRNHKPICFKVECYELLEGFHDPKGSFDLRGISARKGLCE
jgi:hypothetical protein